jgi:Zn-dependent protease
LALVLIFGLLFKFLSPMLGPENLLTNFLFLLTLVNASLFLFNLIPIPPLDGSRVLLAIIPDKFADFKLNFEQYGPFILLGLLILDGFGSINVFGWLFGGMLNFLLIFFG